MGPTSYNFQKENLGLDLLAQFVSVGLVNAPSFLLIDSISAELEANISKSIIALNCVEGK